MNEEGTVDNLRRGGSDYTATLIGGALPATEIQIWTDIDGMHNNDPRVVKDTFPIHEISFNEAAELAYFGAKILHPSCVLPAQRSGVPVKLLNTMKPEAKGTVISENVTPTENKVKAIAAKDGITAIKVKSSRMLNAYGFLKKIFEVFEKYQTSIDMITTSEVAVSLTIDDDTNLDKILNELRTFGIVEVDKEQTIICIAGEFKHSEAGNAARVINTLKEIPLRMISSGGSRSNISILTDTKYKVEAMNALNEGLFAKMLKKKRAAVSL
jgi:aspartate kinase